ncbi:DNA-binding response regulator [Pseudomonas sp. S10E 269]|jgi:two-component system response regulator EvgA|uniref:response regulator transcription factor n=1 Tax=Pseudomonas TaxID=286 RepID=UPI000C26A1B8|nr:MULTISPECIES: response regulator transcription factor [Pseudomonas]MDR6165566.1 two-component system response regulator EvgA [Pseudomonas fluorescens]PJK36298.1 DNA-binding response regulator [Pseudomonas sp. S09F 262]PJK40242.1 DNA-binding response regulator [Pseudomonas sp. S10E 269]
MAYRVLIVDDHPFIRMAVRSLLDQHGYEVIADASNGVDAVSLIRQYVPDLVLLDITMPKLDGIAVINRIRTLKLPTKVIVLTSLASDYYALRCIKAGACGFISKSDDLDLLCEVMKVVMKGLVYYPESVNVSTRKSDLMAREMELIASLSDRELSVLLQLSRGMSNKDIAENIMLSSKTVSCYKARLIAKLNVKSVVDLADLARRNSLI